MATIAGTVLVLYPPMLGPIPPDAAGHLVTASIISAPAAIMVAWLMIPPERGTPGDVRAEPSSANLGSVGFMIGGFTALPPDRRQEIASLALKSVVGGTIATCLTGAVFALVA